MFREMMMKYKGDAEMMEKARFYIDPTIQGLDRAINISEQEDDLRAQDQVSLKLFFDQKDESVPLGFGWKHE